MSMMENKEGKAINLGAIMLEKLLETVQIEYTKSEEMKLKDLLGDNFQDHINLK